MDFHMDLGVIDDVIGKLRWGVDKLDWVRRKLKICMSLCEKDGFEGHNADQTAILIARKMKFVIDLMDTYLKAIEILEKAKQTAVQADQELLKRIGAIGSSGLE